MLAASLHESLLNYLDYHTAADGSVTIVELRIDQYHIESTPLVRYYWQNLRLDGATLSSLGTVVATSYFGLDERSVSDQHMITSNNLESTRPSAAPAPLQTLVARQRVDGRQRRTAQ
ncbi:hypothetical protein FRC12_009245, partial [Ceratobasidium sp. 428]